MALKRLCQIMSDWVIEQPDNDVKHIWSHSLQLTVFMNGVLSFETCLYMVNKGHIMCEGYKENINDSQCLHRYGSVSYNYNNEQKKPLKQTSNLEKCDAYIKRISSYTQTLIENKGLSLLVCQNAQNKLEQHFQKLANWSIQHLDIKHAYIIYTKNGQPLNW